ncbi:uncharacterized protein K02A2.6-like [Papaver somniferum]|uniref:uncharacterized protein K02A2.6-like n=1 Tax=Papaver somniferum TaxID=3469 RepID=UPI000E703A1C|nr:uncharacterized protein K02A2.6-like [Papaver somniferum]
MDIALPEREDEEQKPKTLPWALPKILIYGGSSVEIILYETFKQMGLKDECLIPSTYNIFGFKSSSTRSMGEVTMEIRVGKILTLTTFCVIDMISPYTTIFGRFWVQGIKGVASTYHQSLRFPTPDGITEIIGDLGEEKYCYNMDEQNELVKIGTLLRIKEEEKLVQVLNEYSDVFAWKMKDFPGIDPGVCWHNLKINPKYKPMRQRMRKVAPEYHEAIQNELNKMESSGVIREVQYPIWISNMVIVLKNNGGARICVEFSDLNKACPKDNFPLPNIDQLVEATSGYGLLSLMDEYSGYNQIPLAEEDQENTAFFTPRGLYCYTKISLGLKMLVRHTIEWWKRCLITGYIRP